MNYRRVFLQNGMVFITLVTYNRMPILTKNIDLLINSFVNTNKIYRFRLIAYVILPDHIHCILKPKNIYDYSKIIKSFKYSFSKNVGLVKPTYSKIWQPRFWEHTIRDDEDLHIHLNYIHYNPVKHGLVQQVKNWHLSSFHKFVWRGFYENDWGSNEDIKKIKDLNYE